MRVDNRWFLRELGDIRGELSALPVSVDGPLMAQAIAAIYPDFARQQDKHAWGDFSRLIEQFPFGVAGRAAKAPQFVDFGFRKDREHLLVTRMVEYARVLDDRVEVDTARILRRLTIGGAATRR